MDAQEYEAGYRHAGAEAERFGRWRAISGQGKTRRVLDLLADGPGSVLDIGCGDGMLLGRLAQERPDWELHGVDIAPSAVELASAHVPSADIRRFDGATLPWLDRTFDAAVLSHVVEHLEDPAALVREAGRVCRRVLVEVPLEANVSSRRPSRKELADGAGHIRPLARADLDRIADAAGLQIVAERSGTLPRAAVGFFAETPKDRAVANVRWATQRVLHRGLPLRVCSRIFTVHCAVLCAPRS